MVWSEVHEEDVVLVEEFAANLAGEVLSQSEVLRYLFARKVSLADISTSCCSDSETVERVYFEY